MILYKKVEKPKLNCLFLPGIPGRVKNFAIFDDLIENDINVYIHQYPGTYGKDGVFDIESSKLSVLDSLNKLKKEKLPIILIAYSFSTFIAMQLNLTDKDGIVAILLFSPIAGLDRTSILENFYEVLLQLKNEAEFSINEVFWKEKLQQCKLTNLTKILHNLSNSNIPVAFIYSKNDKSVNIQVLESSIKKYLRKYGYGKFLLFDFPNGDHRIDSYYSDLIRNIITALRVKEDLIKILVKAPHVPDEIK